MLLIRQIIRFLAQKQILKRWATEIAVDQQDLIGLLSQGEGDIGCHRRLALMLAYARDRNGTRFVAARTAGYVGADLLETLTRRSGSLFFQNVTAAACQERASGCQSECGPASDLDKVSSFHTKNR